MRIQVTRKGRVCRCWPMQVGSETGGILICDCVSFTLNDFRPGLSLSAFLACVFQRRTPTRAASWFFVAHAFRLWRKFHKLTDERVRRSQAGGMRLLESRRIGE